MKKVMFLIVVGVLVLPLVIAGSGLTTIFSFANVDDGWLEYSQTDTYLGEDGDWPPAAQSTLSVINLGDSQISSIVEAEKDDRVLNLGGCPPETCNIPNVQRWSQVAVEPLDCPPPPGGGCNDPYKSETIGWGADGEAYLDSTTYTEGGNVINALSIYGKGGAAGSWNSAGHIISSLDEGFEEYSYAALGDFCEDVDECPQDPPDIPEPPERPDCEGGFCP